MNIPKILSEAISHHNNNNLNEAEKLYRKILSKKPNHPDANHNLGVLGLQVGMVKESLPFLENALKASPSDKRYRQTLETAKAKLKQFSNNNNQAQAIDSKLIKLFNNKRYNDALAIAKEILVKNPDHALGWAIVGSILYIIKDYDNALPNLKRAVELNPKDINTLYTLGNLYSEIKNHKEAQNYYLQITKIDGNQSDAYYNLGLLSKNLNKTKEAKNYYEKVIKLDPKYTKAYYNLANLLKNSNKIEEAKNNYIKAIELDPAHIKAHRALSLLIKYTKDTPHLKKLHEIYENTNNTTNKYQLGFALAKAYEDIKEYDKSFFYLEEANKLKFMESSYDINRDKKLFDHIKNLFRNKDSNHIKN